MGGAGCLYLMYGSDILCAPSLCGHCSGCPFCVGSYSASCSERFVNDSTGVVGQLHRCHHVVKVGVVILRYSSVLLLPDILDKRAGGF